MSQKMMLPFSAGALLFLLLSLFGDLALGEITGDFQQCVKFFYNGISPSGIEGRQYQPICQYYDKEYRFATMYHRGHRAPLYSAYKLKVGKGKPSNDWKYEPQLVDVNSTPEMEDFPLIINQNLRDSQAIPEDYSANRGYTRGHLAPVCHQATRKDREATYTLTNIVPQKERSNSGPWSDLETKVLNKFIHFCTGNMYVITGAIPYKIQRLVNDRVSIPEYMWSAYCCPKYKSSRKAPFNHTYAAVGRNDPNSGNDIVERENNSEGYDVKEMTVQELERILAIRLNMSIRLFDNKCSPIKE